MEMKKQVFKREQENLPGKKTTLEMVRTGKSELHYGDQGSTVKQIQQMLLYLGLDLGDKGADTFFGEDTKDAIEEFQTYPDEYGVDIIMLKSQDGIVGDETLKAIEKAVKNKKSVENKKDE
jgi:peptidoglycan hydrolase-like protein with peptidoglycan-binding domain